MRPTPFDPAASAVMRLLAASPVPLPHPAIVKALSAGGMTKEAAKQGIGLCQSRGWIEHNLTTGYVLAGQKTD